MRHVVTLAEIDAHSVPEFRLELDAAVRQASADGGVLDLDFTNVAFMDSTGLAALNNARADLARQGRRLRIHNAAPLVRRLLDITDQSSLLAEDSTD